MTTNPQINNKIKELRNNGLTYILFEERYLLEGEQVGLGRVGESMRYIGDRFTDYGVEPPKVIKVDGSVVCSDLEKLFEVKDE